MIKIYKLKTLAKKILNERRKIFLKKKFKLPYKLYQRRLYFGKYPKALNVELTNRCNLRCSYCPRSKGVRTVGKDMSLGQFKAIVDEAQKLSRLESVTPVGFGDSLLHESLDEAIKFVKTNYPYTSVDIVTNGILLTRERVRPLLDSGLDHITISLNAANKERYLELNSVDKYDLVKKNALDFLEFLRDNPRYKTGVVIQILGASHTEKEIIGFKKFWTPLLPPNGRVWVQRLFNWGGVIDSGKQPEKDELHDYHAKERRPCSLIYGAYYIEQNGNVVACCVASGHDNPGELLLGNVFTQSLKEIFCGQSIKRLRGMSREGELSKIALCRNCDIWKIAPDIWFKNPFYPWLGKRWI